MSTCVRVHKDVGKVSSFAENNRAATGSFVLAR